MIKRVEISDFVFVETAGSASVRLALLLHQGGLRVGGQTEGRYREVRNARFGELLTTCILFDRFNISEK